MTKRLLSIAVFLSVLAVGANFIPNDSTTDMEQATPVSSSISWGSRGDDVKTIQTKLKNWGYFDGNVDGVYGEARGEPYIGKVAVADGQINLEPDAESLKAARDALNGWDPTYGCSYYWNPVTSTSKWIWSRKVMVNYPHFYKWRVVHVTIQHTFHQN